MRQVLPIPSQLHGMIWHHDDTAGHYPGHSHVELEFNLCLRGTATYVVDNSRVELQPNCLFWLFPAQSHQLIDRSRDFAMWIVVLRKNLLRAVATYPAQRLLLRRDPRDILLKTIPATAARTAATLLQDLSTCIEVPAVFNPGLAYAVVRIWEMYQKAAPTSVLGKVHPAVRKAVHLLAEEEAEDEDSTLAHRCGLSRARLSHLFKKQMKVSLVDFRNRQRLERYLARPHTEVLGTTLLAAALDAGFGSYAQFHRVHWKLTGESPLARLARMRS